MRSLDFRLPLLVVGVLGSAVKCSDFDDRGVGYCPPEINVLLRVCTIQEETRACVYARGIVIGESDITLSIEGYPETATVRSTPISDIPKPAPGRPFFEFDTGLCQEGEAEIRNVTLRSDLVDPNWQEVCPPSYRHQETFYDANAPFFPDDDTNGRSYNPHRLRNCNEHPTGKKQEEDS